MGVAPGQLMGSGRSSSARAVAAETAGQSHERCSQADRFAVVKQKRRKGRVRREGGILTGLAWVAQLVERVLGKDEVTGSIPVPGSRISVVAVG